MSAILTGLPRPCQPHSTARKLGSLKLAAVGCSHLGNWQVLPTVSPGERASLTLHVPQAVLWGFILVNQPGTPSDHQGAQRGSHTLRAPPPGPAHFSKPWWGAPDAELQGQAHRQAFLGMGRPKLPSAWQTPRPRVGAAPRQSRVRAGAGPGVRGRAGL